jgi:hypothetical protein
LDYFSWFTWFILVNKNNKKSKSKFLEGNCLWIKIIMAIKIKKEVR